MTTLNYSFSGTTLSVSQLAGNANQAEFLWPIAQVIPIAGCFVVRVKPPSNACYNQNVFGVDAEGKIIWQVPSRPLIDESSPYIGMVELDGRVKLLNWGGTTLIVDPVSGIILEEGFEK